MSFIDDIINFFAAPLRSACPQTPCIPTSTLVVIAVAFLLSLLTTSANRFLVDYKMITSSRREYMAYTKALNKAMKEGDEKQVDKLMKRKAAMTKMSMRATGEQMKTTAITFVPLLLIYNVILAVFGSRAVALSPVYIPGAAFSTDIIKTGAAVLSVLYWYFLCSFVVSVPLSRIFGIQTYSLTPPRDDGK